MTGGCQSLLDKFLVHLRVERGLSPATWMSYRYQIEPFLRFLFESGMSLLSSGMIDVVGYLENRKNSGAASSSLFASANAIRQFYRFLESQGISFENSPSKLRQLRQESPITIKFIGSCWGLQ